MRGEKTALLPYLMADQKKEKRKGAGAKCSAPSRRREGKKKGLDARSLVGWGEEEDAARERLRDLFYEKRTHSKKERIEPEAYAVLGLQRKTDKLPAPGKKRFVAGKGRQGDLVLRRRLAYIRIGRGEEGAEHLSEDPARSALQAFRSKKRQKWLYREGYLFEGGKHGKRKGS